MRKKMTFILIVSLMLCLPFGIAQAATTISFVPVLDTVTVGDTILLDLIVNPDVAVYGGTVEFTFDSSLVSPLPLVFDFFSVGADANIASLYDQNPIDGIFDTIDFANDPTGLLTGTDNYVAQLSFSADNVGIADFGLSAVASWYDPDTFADITGSIDFSISPASVTINAVPIPATMLLFGSSIVGLIGLRRGRRG